MPMNFVLLRRANRLEATLKQISAINVGSNMWMQVHMSVCGTEFYSVSIGFSEVASFLVKLLQDFCN